MNAKQEDKYSMYLAVTAIAERHSTTWQPLAAFATDYAEWSAHVRRIRDLAQRQQAPSGAAATKQALRQAMTTAALEVAGPLGAYASKLHDADLAAVAALTHSGLGRLRDTLVSGPLRGLHTAATAKLAGLAPYGVTAAKLTTLDNAIKAYEAVIAGPRERRVESKQATLELAGAFQAADALLESSLDRLVGPFKTTVPDFYHAWQAARIIVDSAAGAGTPGQPHPPVPPPVTPPVAPPPVPTTPPGSGEPT